MMRPWISGVGGGDARHILILREWREGRDGHFKGRGAGSWGLRFEERLDCGDGWQQFVQGINKDLNWRAKRWEIVGEAER